MKELLYDPSNIRRLRRLMGQHGFREHASQMQTQAWLRFERAHVDFDCVVDEATFLMRGRAGIPKGFDSLPPGWLKALPHILWSLRKPHWDYLPFMIYDVRATDGMLKLRFSQEPLRELGDDRISVFDRVRIAVNAALYPSRWRPLKRKHALILAANGFRSGVATSG